MRNNKIHDYLVISKIDIATRDGLNFKKFPQLRALIAALNLDSVHDQSISIAISFFDSSSRIYSRAAINYYQDQELFLVLVPKYQAFPCSINIHEIQTLVPTEPIINIKAPKFRTLVINPIEICLNLDWDNEGYQNIKIIFPSDSVQIKQGVGQDLPDFKLDYIDTGVECTSHTNTG